MRCLNIFLLFFFLISGLSHAQSRIQVSVSSFIFDDENRVYCQKNEDIENGEILVYYESKDTCLCFPIVNSSIEHPIVNEDDRTIVLLYYKGRCYHTKSFGMNSSISQSSNWIFNIEENALSKKIFGSYYFSLSIQGIECGRVKFDNRCLYHHEGRKLKRFLRSKGN